MVQQFDHSSLHFSVTRFIVIESLCSHSVDFVNENDGRCFCLCQSEGISDHLGSITNVHLHKTGTSQFQESGLGLSSTCSCHHSLSCSWGTEHETTFRRSDTYFLELLFMGDWQNNSLSQFFNLFIESTNISVLFTRFLINFHGFHSAVIFIRQFLKKDISVLVHSYQFSWFQRGRLNNKTLTSTSPGTGKNTVFLVLVFTTTHLSSGFSSVSTVPSSLNSVGISNTSTILDTSQGNCLFCLILDWLSLRSSLTRARSCLILFAYKRNCLMLLSNILILFLISSSVKCLIDSLISANTAGSIIF